MTKGTSGAITQILDASNTLVDVSGFTVTIGGRSITSYTIANSVGSVRLAEDNVQVTIPASALSGLTGSQTVGIQGTTSTGVTLSSTLGSVTFYDGLIPAEILPLDYLSDDVREALAERFEIASNDIRLLTSAHLSAPQEPTQKMRDIVKNDGFEMTHKYNTVSVDQDGYYAFIVVVSDDLVGKNVNDYKLYLMGRDTYAEASAVKLAFAGLMNGLGTVIDFNVFGLKVDTLKKQMLVVGLFQASQPFSVYLAKILLMLATGCDAGVGLGVLGFAVVGGVLLMRRWRRR
ncbi:MAG: hypothetical protein IJ702_02795 [Fretibacterium sp.]|nr:hypothetical protein [Fretibacterium sp.]